MYTRGDIMLIDTHVHLNAKQFNDTLEDVIKRALENDVSKMIVVGYDNETNKRAIELAETYEFIYATVGFHPTDAKNVSDKDKDHLLTLLNHPKVVGIGECGLDFYWDKEHIEEQISLFKDHYPSWRVSFSIKFSISATASSKYSPS